MVDSCQINTTTSTTTTSTSNSMALTGLPHLAWLAMASRRKSHGWRGLKVSAKPCHANKLTGAAELLELGTPLTAHLGNC